MPELRTCPRGHQWEPSPGPFPPGEGSACPVCRLLGGTIAPVEMPAPDPATQLSSQENPSPGASTTAQEEAASFGSGPAVDLRFAVAGYEILEVVGQGAMASVYRARQTRLGRQVALKMLLAGPHASPRALARFRAEAEAVARLQHPNIVQIYEVGEQGGLPYLSLELVDGGSLAGRLDGGPLDPREAARLVETLASAAHYAHRHSLVHRDLKPANILLTADGVPKIADFGLAKDLDQESGQTRTGAVVGTPSYMAPEQAAGKVREIGPATDVYALGAILYELLTGRAPFHADTVLDTLEQVRSREPVPPSQLQPKVPGDLETICLKCLHKEPARRFASAEELAQDLERFRTGQPIRARPVGLGERALKWARRRPAAAALVVVCALGAVCLWAVILWSYYRVARERDRANASFQQAMEAMGWLTEAEERLPPEPELEQERRSRLDRALAFYQAFLRDRGDDPAVRTEIAAALQRVGDIARLLGRQEQARDAYGRAIAQLSKLTAGAPDEPLFRERLAYCHTFLGESLRAAGQAGPAREAYGRALEVQQKLAADFPRRPAYRRDLARCHANLGIVLGETGHPRQAEQAFQEARGFLEELVKQDPGEPSYRQELARCHLNLGPVLRRAGRLPEAEDAYRQAVALLKGLAAQFPRKPDYRHELAVTYGNLGNLRLSARRFPASQEAYDEARRLLQELVTDYPRRPVYRKELANTWNSLGAVLALRDAAGEAERAWSQAVRLFRELHAEFPEVADYRGGLGMALGNRGWLGLCRQPALALAPLGGHSLGAGGLLFLRARELAGIRQALEEARDHLKAVLKPNPNHPAYRQALRNVYRDLAETLLQLGEHAPAARAATFLPRTFPDQGADDYLGAHLLARCGTVAAGDARLSAEAREAAVGRYADQAVQLLREAVHKGHRPARSLRDDPTFRPLLGRSSFTELLKELEARAGPAHP